jgi:hypothetical protein
MPQVRRTEAGKARLQLRFNRVKGLLQHHQAYLRDAPLSQVASHNNLENRPNNKADEFIAGLYAKRPYQGMTSFYFRRIRASTTQ